MHSNIDVVTQSKCISSAVRLAAAACMTLLLAATAIAQTGGASPQLQEKLAALKQSAAQNKQKLHKYQWTEIQQVNFKGEDKPAKSFSCQYGPDGTVQKTPMAQSQPQQQQQGRGGRLKQHVVEKKTDEMQQYMGQVKSLLAMYVPPGSLKMQQAFKAGNVSMNPDPSAGLVDLVFKNYAQPGDQMTVAFNSTTKNISTLNVNTYMGQAKDAVILTVNFSTLPDGTNYAEKTVLNVAAKQIVVTTTNTNYHPLGGM